MGKLPKSPFLGIGQRAKGFLEKQFGKSIKTLRSDRGGKYISTEFTQFLKDNGI